MGERIASIPLTALDVRDQEHRLSIDIPALAQSIQNSGQINPITVRKVGARYRIVSGRRRFSALKYLQKLNPKKPIKALVYVKDLNDLQEELITIDENIQRAQLGDAEFDEAIYRRKQIYEELHPETKQGTAGGIAKNDRTKATVSFSKDAARNLSVSRRTIEKSISRAAKASDSVKKARAAGLLQSKVDLLVTLEPRDQDILLPVIQAQGISQAKRTVELARKHGARAAVHAQDQDQEPQTDSRLAGLVRASDRLRESLTECLRAELVFRGDAAPGCLAGLDHTAKAIEAFLTFQKHQLGQVRAIRRRDGKRIA